MSITVYGDFILEQNESKRSYEGVGSLVTLLIFQSINKGKKFAWSSSSPAMCLPQHGSEDVLGTAEQAVIWDVLGQGEGAQYTEQLSLKTIFEASCVTP